MERLKVNQDVDNKTLLTAFEEFFADQTEEKHQVIVDEVNKATFLMPILAKESDVEKVGEDLVMKDTALVNFIGCLNEENEGFMPVFTSAKELDKFTENAVDKSQIDEGVQVGRLVLSADMIWAMLMQDKSVCGTVIDPLTIGWVIRTEQLMSIEE